MTSLQFENYFLQLVVVVVVVVVVVDVDVDVDVDVVKCSLEDAFPVGGS